MVARRKKRHLTEEEEVIQFLRKEGFKEITKKDKKELWYQEHLRQLERWRKEEVGKPFSVRERKALYGSKPPATSKAKAKHHA